MTTCTNVGYEELGCPPLKSIVLAKQRRLYQRLWQERRDMCDNPSVHAVRLTMTFNTPMNTHIDNLKNFVDHVAVGIESQTINCELYIIQKTKLPLNEPLSNTL